MLKHKNLTLFALLLTSVMWGQQPISLDQALQEALRNNRSALNANRDIEMAQKQYWEAIAIGLPQISASTDYTNAIEQPISIIPAEALGGNPGEFREVSFGDEHTVSAQARVDQLIFDGSYLVGLQASKVFLAISKQAKIKNNLELRRLVTDAYLSMLLAIEQTEVLSNNVANVEATLLETQKMVDNGLVEEELVEQLHITLTSLKSSLDYSQRMVPITKNMLNLVMGKPLSDPIHPSDDLLGLCMKQLGDNTDATLDLEQNIDYQIAQNDQRSKELLHKLERFRALPTISAFASGGYDGYGDAFDFLERDQSWFGRASMGVSINLPIFSSGLRHASTQRAKINVEKAKTQVEETEAQLMLQWATLKNQYTLAMENFKRSQENLSLAERIENKNQIKFNEGLVGSFTLRDAQIQLYQAQNEYLAAMQSVILARTNLDILLFTTPKNEKK
ncbi:MAG: TolC family protein [Flavobacteriaceae bacterium]